MDMDQGSRVVKELRMSMNHVGRFQLAESQPRVGSTFVSAQSAPLSGYSDTKLCTGYI